MGFSCGLSRAKQVMDERCTIVISAPNQTSEDRLLLEFSYHQTTSKRSRQEISWPKGGMHNDANLSHSVKKSFSNE